MKYYKILNERGEMIAIGTDCGGVEITQEEYMRIEVELQAKAVLTEAILNGEMDAEDIPDEWREEILADAEAIRQQEAAAGEQEIGAEEALEIILGGEIP
jgi:hypothetical protein